MKEFSYVYILESLSEEAAFYIGLTNDLSARVARHDAGGVPHTSKQRPWRIKTAVAFRDRQKRSAKLGFGRSTLNHGTK